MPSNEKALATVEADLYDVIIVGAGISGINAGYRVQEAFPNYSYTILENRDAMGGTWDLFRYPGIRSDSDLHTFGFEWRPWNQEQDIADGHQIRQYIKESAAAFNIDKHIRYRHKVTGADWSTRQKEWRVTADTGGQTKSFRGRFFFICTGYYDYEQPLATTVPDIDKFKGQRIHPQFWPEDLNYTNKKVAIVGSGATAITLLPVLAEKASKVTMIQRSPTFILSLPRVPKSNKVFHAILPRSVAYKIVRFLNLLLPYVFFLFCRACPTPARFILRRLAALRLPSKFPLDPHFQPSYNPWEQRLCVCPDADFYRSLKTSKAEIVTGSIESISGKQIHVRGTRSSDPTSTVKDDTVVDADILITATGLKLVIAGGAAISIDGKRADLSTKFMWKGVLLEDIPNLAVTVGYTNASWTLGADATALHVCRLIREMDQRGAHEVKPELTAEEKRNVKERSLLNLNSTYIEKGKSVLPKAGDRAPWRARHLYWIDIWEAQWGSIRKGLQYLK